MATKLGTQQIADLFANQQTVDQFGLEPMAEAIAFDMQVHNDLMREQLSDFCMVTTERTHAYGTSDNGAMDQLDEYGMPRAQKISVGTTLSFPIRKYGKALGWTSDYFRQVTVADLMAQVDGIKKADAKRVIAEIKTAMYTSANPASFADKLVAPQVSLTVKRFLNADSVAIPEGPNGETYTASSHTHYIGSATLTNAAVLSLHDTVLEHGHSDGLRIIISRTDRTAFEALSGFKAYQDSRIVYTATDVNKVAKRLDRLDNLAIGTFGSAEVWVKPWAIANYVLCLAVDDVRKPLGFRELPQAGMQGLRLVAQNDSYPLHAEAWVRYFGVGVWHRTNGGVLYFANATFADPTITA
jgi:hypothetical protein